MRYLCMLSVIVLVTAADLGKAQHARVSEGDIGSLTIAVLDVGYVHPKPSLKFKFRWRAKTIPIEVIVYDLNKSPGQFDHNCTAVARRSQIVCDISFVDELIAEWYLVSHWPHGSSVEASRDWYRRNILLWILAHEMGHIIHGDGLSDFIENPKGMHVFDAPQQRIELDADLFAISLIGNLTRGPSDAYSAVLSIANSLIRKAVCPAQYPDVCGQMPSGVGLLFDYTPDAQPLRIILDGDHPDMMARFLRILYLAGVGTHENSINYLAKQAIDMLCVDTGSGTCQTLRSALASQAKSP